MGISAALQFDAVNGEITILVKIEQRPVPGRSFQKIHYKERGRAGFDRHVLHVHQDRYLQAVYVNIRLVRPERRLGLNMALGYFDHHRFSRLWALQLDPSMQVMPEHVRNVDLHLPFDSPGRRSRALGNGLAGGGLPGGRGGWSCAGPMFRLDRFWGGLGAGKQTYSQQHD